MPQVTVYIAQKPYQLACDDGEEQHVEALAHYFNSKVREIGRATGPAPDNLLFLMAALTMADQLGEYERDIESLKRQVEQLTHEMEQNQSSQHTGESHMRDALSSITQRIEQSTTLLHKEPESD